MDCWKLKNTLDWHTSWRDSHTEAEPYQKRRRQRMVIELLEDKENPERTCIKINGQIDEQTEWRHYAKGTDSLKMRMVKYSTMIGKYDEANEWLTCDPLPHGLLFLKMTTTYGTRQCTRHYAFEEDEESEWFTASDKSYLCQCSQIPPNAELNYSLGTFIFQYMTNPLELKTQGYHIQLFPRNTLKSTAVCKVCNQQQSY